jgi:hypothetical protein
MMAARWLGGGASEVLTGHTALTELLIQGTRSEPTAFLVRRQSEVSHQAMMSRHDPGPEAGEAAATDAVLNDTAW